VRRKQGHCRFEIAAPRHFLYPSLLLLLAEEPRHGYRLVDSLLRLGFGPVDRPSIYRALGDLEADGLLHSWEVSPKAGSTRQIYGLTDEGHRRLADWMGVVTAEHSALEAVLKRFDNLGDDSAEVEEDH
jgi:DNA-binding PadR family transcriptional regulator